MEAVEAVATSSDVGVSTDLCKFIQRCPSAYHAADVIRQCLEQAGFQGLHEAEPWHIRRGGTYYVMRNGSSIMGIRIGKNVREVGFRIAASHIDSPSFKVKAMPTLTGPGAYLRLNVEGYGGMINRTWLDRPLSVAGRAMVAHDGRIQSRLAYVDNDILLIPSVAIHQDRKVNDGAELNHQIDLCPLFSAGELEAGAFEQIVAHALDVEPAAVLSYDLFLVNRQEPVVWGAGQEFVSAPRIDNLQCTFAALNAFLASHNDNAITVCACFDNEEVGSGTMQGALSTFVPNVLGRVCEQLSSDGDGYAQALSRSFVASCDNAHALHPNHPEKYDEGNRVYLNGGVVIKETANQRYATDAVGRALFKTMCQHAGVPTQAFANRSDLLGGSTLGNLLMRQASMRTVDVGCPQLAMHSAFETAGVKDTSYMARALQAFFDMPYRFEPDGSVSLG